MIHEEYDASLIVLRRRFQWTYADIFYRKYVMTYSGKINLSEGAIKKLLSPKRNLGEKLLYDSLNDTWWKQPELQQNNFWEEVK